MASDVHEVSQPEDDAMLKERLELLREYLERKYRTRITKMDRLDRGVLRLDRKDGDPWVVRVFPVKRPPERVRGDAEVLRYLEEQGFPAERCVTEADPVSFAGGRSFIVTQFVQGSRPAKDPATAKRMGEILGTLHALPVPSTGGPSRDAGALNHYATNGGDVRNELDAALSWLESVEKDVPGNSMAVHDSLLEQVKTAGDLRGLPKAVTHPDPVTKNAIAAKDSNESITLIDWTDAGRGQRVGALGLLVWGSALGEGEGGWSAERVDAVIKGYRSRVQLEKEEITNIDAAMRIRPLVFGCFCFRRAIRAGKTPDGTEWWMPDEGLVQAISSRARASLSA